MTMDEDLRRRLDEAAARLRSGASEAEEVQGPTGTMRLVRGARTPGGFRVDAEMEGGATALSIQSFPASPTRPEGYPAHLPFLEECAALSFEGRNRILWMNPSDPEGAFGRLVDATRAEGWEEVPLPPVRAHWEGRRQAEFRMPGRERTITLRSMDPTSVLDLTDRAVE